MPRRVTPTPPAVRHAKIVDTAFGFVVRCADCKWRHPEKFAVRPKAEAAVDMHEVIRH